MIIDLYQLADIEYLQECILITHWPEIANYMRPSKSDIRQVESPGQYFGNMYQSTVEFHLW